jgi:5-methyltetrahydrofolate corrinoid/iron sulfur protein methyltransferase
MLVIGERINATRRAIARAIDRRDAVPLVREAQAQADAGADFIDVNAGSDPAREIENLRWALQVVQDATDRPLCIDSADPRALAAGLEVIRGDTVMLNSVTGGKQKLHAVLPLAVGSGARLIALAMDERGVPHTADQRVDVAGRILESAEAAGLPRRHVYVDPCLQPISTGAEQGPEVLSAVRRIMRDFPGVHTTCGLSNVSFGLPNRSLVNRTYLACLIAAGLDSAVLDPTAEGIMVTVLAAEALAARDEFCMNYVRAMRR